MLIWGKIYYNSRDIEFFIEVTFLARLVYTGRAKKSNPYEKFDISGIVVNFLYIQGAPKKEPQEKCDVSGMVVHFFRQIYKAYRGGFRPHILQNSSQYLVAFKSYNYLNLNVHDLKITSLIFKPPDLTPLDYHTWVRYWDAIHAKTNQQC